MSGPATDLLLVPDLVVVAAVGLAWAAILVGIAVWWWRR